MQKRFIIAVIVALILVVGALTVNRRATHTPNESINMTQGPLTVRAERIAERKTAFFDFSYPGTITNESEALITAQVAGTVTLASPEVNQYVGSGQLLFKIDETGSAIASQNGFQSADIQQAELILKNAEKDYTEAKHNDDRDETTASEIAKDQARNNRDIALLTQRSLLDKHLIKSPIAGIVTLKNVAVGDTVSLGTPLATVSNGKKTVKFYINEDEHTLLTQGQPMEMSRDIAGKNRIPGKVLRVSPNADPLSRRFLVEAESTDPIFKALPSGSLVTVFLSLKKTADADTFFVPISAIIREQNTISVLIAEAGRVKKVPVTLLNIIGETVELSGITDTESLIILTNVKQLTTGDEIIID
ncbi:MAG: efflux RND transporter periplasmic adaptor subunit [Minisyncoccota bacterium]